MSAYLIGDVEVINAEVYREYRQKFDPILQEFGGRLLVAGGAVEAIEGDWEPKRLVILEFPSADHARRWYASPGYQAIAPIRWKNAVTHFVTLVEGF